MRLKLIITLLFLNGLVFYAIHYFKHQPTHEIVSQNLLGNVVKDIDRIEVCIKGETQVRSFERIDNEWMITKPMSWPANLFAIQRIITQLQFLSPEVTFSLKEIERSGQNLEDYGLKDPNMTLTFWSGFHKSELHIGKATNLGNRVYVLSPNKDDILVIKESLLESLTTDLKDLRNSQLFNIPIFELNTLTAQLLSPYNLKIRLTRKGESWAFEAPFEADANSTLVNDAINQLTSINAKRFITDKDAKANITGLLHPKMKVTLVGNNRKQTLLIGNIDKEDASENTYYAQLENRPTIFTVSAAPFLALQGAQEALREKHFINLDPTKIKNITISQSGSAVNLHKLESGVWKVLTKDEKGNLNSIAADNEVVTRLIEKIRKLEAVSFLSDAPSAATLNQFGLEEPQRLIQIVSTDDEQELLIGNVNDETGHLYAKMKNSPFIYEVQANILAEVPVSVLHYQDRLLNQLPNGAIIESMKLTFIPKDKILFERSLHGTNSNWEKLLESESPDKRTALLAMIHGAYEFKVKDYLQKQFTQSVKLDKNSTLPWVYKLELRVLLPGGEHNEKKSLEYYFTKRLSGSLQIGGSPSRDSIFKLNQDWVDNLFVFHDETQEINQS